MLRCDSRMTTTPMEKPYRNDLSLLMSLHVLLEEGSVTRAAKRLFITQSAMSKSLQRLRTLFDDPLVIRTQTGLVMTPRAREISMQLERIFAQVEDCLSPPRFDPASAQGLVRIAAPEQFALVAIPGLVVRLRELAPNLSVESQHLMDNHLEMLASGELDFVIDIDQPFSNNFSARPICAARPMLWYRTGHPIGKVKNIGPADICNYPLVTFRTQNLAQADFRAIKDQIIAANLNINVILDTSHLLIAIDVLAKTDAVMLAPDYISSMPILRNSIIASPVDHIPVFDRYRINLSLVQHKRTCNSPLHKWIANEIANTFSSANNP